MNKLTEFPEKARVSRKIPKSKFYEHITPTQKVKELFTREVQKVLWEYKLSPETVNIPAAKEVEEIQIFLVELKEKELSDEILRQIDRAIPSPIIFILQYRDTFQYRASLKRDKNISDYFSTEWFTNENENHPLPVEGDLEKLYHRLLKMIISLPDKPHETIDELTERVQGIKMRETDIEKLQKRLRSQKQFKKQVEMNAEIRNLQKELRELYNG